MRSFKSILYLFVPVSILWALAATAWAQFGCVKPFAVPSGSEPAPGTQFVLKQGNPQEATSPGWFNPVVLPSGGTGGASYRENIEFCNSSSITLGDLMEIEPGNMIGPTTQGVSGLISQAPDDYFDTRNQCVVSQDPKTPRIAPILVYDVTVFDQGSGRKVSVRVSGFRRVFIEGTVGGDVIARAADGIRVCQIDEPNGEISCNDGRDNDGDRLVDQEDPDCQVPR